eukprot:jgi/Galph1/1242/GphlegSOOS_G5922.1
MTSSHHIIEDYSKLSLALANENFSVLGKIRHVFVEEATSTPSKSVKTVRRVTQVTLNPISSVDSSNIGVKELKLYFHGYWQVVSCFLQQEDVISVSNPCLGFQENDSLDEYPLFIYLNSSDSYKTQKLAYCTPKDNSRWEDVFSIASSELSDLAGFILDKVKKKSTPERRKLFVKSLQIKQLCKRYHIKVDKPLMRSRKYTKLSELAEQNCSPQVDVYGVIANLRALRPTKGNNFVCEAQLIDPTQYLPGQEVTLMLFTASSSNGLPIKAIGDILRINNVAVQRYQDKIQLIIKSGMEASVELFDGEIDQEIAVAYSLGNMCTSMLDDQDIQIIKQLRQWSQCHFSSLESNRSSRVERKVFQDLFFSNSKSDIIVRIESIQKHGSELDTILLVWDGISYNKESNDKLCTPVVLKAVAKKMQTVFHFPLVENGWILLRDVSPRDAAIQEKRYILFDLDTQERTCSTFIYLKEWMYRVQQKLSEMEQSDWTALTYEANHSTTLFKEEIVPSESFSQHPDSFTSFQQNWDVPLQNLFRFRVVAKLVGFRPRDVRKFTVPCCRECHQLMTDNIKDPIEQVSYPLVCTCHRSTHNGISPADLVKHVEFQYLFYLILKDANNYETPVLVDNSAGKKLFSSIEAGDLYLDIKKRYSIFEILTTYLQPSYLKFNIYGCKISAEETVFKLIDVTFVRDSGKHDETWQVLKK